jgi:glutamate racemase
VREGLERPEDLPPPSHRFLATGDPAPFAKVGRRFLGPEIGNVSGMHRGARSADEEKLCS